MKNIFLFSAVFVFLRGEVSFEGKFYAHVAEIFSITLSSNTLSHYFTPTEIADNNDPAGVPIVMGSFDVTITDTLTTPSVSVDEVFFYSLLTDSDTGRIAQLRRIHNSSALAPTEQPKIDLIVTDTIGTTGSSIDAGDAIFTRTRSESGVTDEIHTIRFEAAVNQLNSSNPGNYRNTVYFVLVST